MKAVSLIFIFLFLTSFANSANSAGTAAVSLVQSTAGAAFSSPNTAGNTIIAVIQWLASSGSVSVSSVNDSRGNTYTLIPGSLANAGPTLHSANIYTQMAYATNINGGSNTVTVTMNTGPSPAVSLLEVTPSIFNQTSTASGNSADPSAGSITTSANGNFAVATTFVDDGFGGGPSVFSGGSGPGWIIFQSWGGGAYDDGSEYIAQATAGPLTGNFTKGGGTWVASMADFVPDPIIISETQIPTVPTGLAASAVSSTQINLSWSASTVNVGPVEYDIFRDGTLVGTSNSNSYSDTRLTVSTQYSYTVSAYNAVGNSAQSASISATPFSGTSNIYIAQNIIGTGDGTSCTDAQDVSFFNTASNWAAAPTPGKIGPGTTVHLCGTFNAVQGTTLLSFQGSGTAGNPITLLFESGALLQSLYFDGSHNFDDLGGAISTMNNSYIVIDGGTTCGWIKGAFVPCNGTIEDTDNGSYLDHQNNSAAILADSCNNCEFKNLNIVNLYIHQPPQTIQSITGNASGSPITVTCTTNCPFVPGVVVTFISTSNASYNSANACGINYIASQSLSPTQFTATYDTAANGAAPVCGQTPSGNATGGYVVDVTVDQTAVNAIVTNGQNVLIHNNNIHDVGWALNGGSQVYNNNIYNMDHGVVTNGPIYSNHIHDMANWDQGIAGQVGANGYHHDGIHEFGSLTSPASDIYVYNNLFDGNPGNSATGFVFFEGGNGATSGTPWCGELCSSSTSYFFNNVVIGGTVVLGGGNNNLVANNTVICQNGGQEGIILTGSSNSFFKNNAIENCGWFFIFSNYTFNNVATDIIGNQYANCGGYNCFSGLGADTSVFSDWQSISGGADPSPSAYNPASLNLNSDGTPTANSPVLYGGVNLSSMCAGPLALLCSDLNGNARPAAGAWDSGAFQAVSTDTTPPTVPTGLTARTISSTQINLTWQPSTDIVSVSGYYIYRNGVQVGTSATTSFSDTGLSPSTTYNYTVSAYDPALNVSAQSSPAVSAITYNAGYNGGEPVSVVQTAAGGNSFGGTKTSAAFSSANTAGNTIIAVIQWASSAPSSISSVTDTNGNSYTIIPGSLANNGAAPHYGNIYTQMAYVNNIAVGSNTVTVIWNNGVGGLVSLIETNPAKFDQASIGTGTTSTPNAGSLSPTANGALAVATALEDDGFGGSTVFAGGTSPGWMLFQDNGGGAEDEGSEYIAQGTAAPLSGSFTKGGGTWVASMADFVPVVPVSSVQYGDLNGAANGQVTIYDAELVAQYVVGLITLTPAQMQAAEVSSSTETSPTIYDAFLIAEYAVGLITKFPVQS